MGITVYIAHPNYPKTSAEADFPHLSRSLHSLGLQISQNLESAEVLISVNHSPSHLKLLRGFAKSKKLKVLIRLEPQATYPIQYLKRTANLYDLVITPGSLRPENRRIMWPYFYQANPLRPSTSAPSLESLNKRSLRLETKESWNMRPYLLSLVSSNKNSPTKHNNYSLRRYAVKELSSRGLETFGEMWHAPFHLKIRESLKVAWGAAKTGYFPNPLSLSEGLCTQFPEVRGVVEDKHSIIRASKYSLVIENDSFYVSEKVIDALVGGSLPFYIGGKLELVGLRGSVVRRVENFDQIIETISKISSIEIDQWRYNIHLLLNSPDFINEWSGENVYQRIASTIASRLHS